MRFKKISKQCFLLPIVSLLPSPAFIVTVILINVNIYQTIQTPKQQLECIALGLIFGETAYKQPQYHACLILLFVYVQILDSFEVQLIYKTVYLVYNLVNFDICITCETINKQDNVHIYHLQKVPHALLVFLSPCPTIIRPRQSLICLLSLQISVHVLKFI